MNDKQFDGAIERLRTPERVARLEVSHVVDLCLEGEQLDSVLDVGVGSGLFAEAFSRRGLKVAGVDLSPQMVLAAREFVPQGNFHEAAAEKLPFPDDSFDLVFMGLLLHESDEPLRVLQEGQRVSRKKVCVLEWPYRDEEVGPPLAHRFSPSQISEMAQQTGFISIESESLKHLVLYRLAA